MKSIFLTFITLCTLYTSAQVTTTTYTAAAARTVRPFTAKTIVNEYKLTAPDKASLQRIEQEEETREGDKGFKFAHAIDVNISPLKYGKWSVDGTYSSWTTKFVAPGATCLSINFSKFNLPANTEIYISNGDRTMITGPITDSENNAAGVWGSAVYKGNELLIEIKLPISNKDRLVLESQSIAYGYKEIFREKEFGDAGGCNINVLCPLGNGWEGERNAASVVLNASSTRFCSGSLINNACYRNIPYYLTANHCFSDGNFANWKFLFQYWSPQCTPNQNGSTSVLYNGSQLRANFALSDFRLLQLNQTPPSNSGLHYAGWNRNTASITSLTGIHHPSADVMKISQVNAAPFKSSYLGGPGTDHWEMDWVSTANGITEGGSSGSPLFDQNHRIIGQLHGGYSSCTSSDLRDWYGAFDVSWTGGGTNATRLSNWLDPNGSNAMTTNTTEISSLVGSAITGGSLLCSSTGSYAITAPAGATITWTSSDPAAATISPSGNPATLTRQTPMGSTLITATIIFNGCTTTVSKSVDVGGTQLASMSIVNALGTTDSWCSSHMQNGYTLDWHLGVIGTADVELRSVPSMTLLSTTYGVSGTAYLTPPPPVPPAPGWYSVLARHYNVCGELSTAGIFVESKDCSFFRIAKDAPAFNIQLSPNPVKGTLYVTITGADQQTAKQQTSATQLTLREMISARIVKQWSFPSNQQQLSLNLADIKKGNYMLTVQQGAHKQSKQIIVE